MSEYQYYEFQAVDRPLTPEQMSELRACSSRARISSTSFVNSYNYGSFKGNPDQWMEKYFDAFLYFANWGTRWFMLRLPGKLLDQQVAATYCAGDNFSCYQKTDSVILSFRSEDEDYESSEEEDSLASILPIRSDLMRGDYRALYLGWLLAVRSGEVGSDASEPPVPPGLGNLNASLDSLGDFLRIDPDLIAAAAESSPDEHVAGLSRKEIDAWVLNIPTTEKDALLVRLIEGDDPYLAAELRQLLMNEVRRGEKANPVRLRTAGEIVARAKIIAEVRKKKEAEQRAQEKAMREREQAEKRERHLQALLGKESILWKKVETLIAARQPGQYAEAVSLLLDLHDLSDRAGTSADFRSRMDVLAREHTRKPALLERLRKAKLL